ncbi:MAG: Panacea domain-containing protein [Prevotella sp.]
MKPYDVNTVADYVIMSLNSDESFSLVNLKLQKLMYYIQAWSLGINKVAMIDARFEAWVHGPVCRKLYDRFSSTKSLYSVITKEDIRNKDAVKEIDAADREFIDYILENFARYSGTQLETMTHSELPWIEARGGVGPMEHCENQISEATMMAFYGKRYEKIPEN